MYIIRKHMIGTGVERFIIYLKLPFSNGKIIFFGPDLPLHIQNYRYMYSTSLYICLLITFSASVTYATHYLRHLHLNTATDDIQLLKFIVARPKLNFLLYHIFK